MEAVDQIQLTDRDPKGLATLVFVENQKLLDTVNIEEIGTLIIPLTTMASQCVAEGKGLKEGTVGRRVGGGVRGVRTNPLWRSIMEG